jgi:hypothetical protein
VHRKRQFCRRVERLTGGKVESREVKRAGNRWRGGARWGEKAAIQLAILMSADAINGVQHTSAIGDKDRLSARPGETHRAIGEFCCGEETFVKHGERLRRADGCRRLRCKRCI